MDLLSQGKIQSKHIFIDYYCCFFLFSYQPYGGSSSYGGYRAADESPETTTIKVKEVGKDKILIAQKFNEISNKIYFLLLFMQQQK